MAGLTHAQSVTILKVSAVIIFITQLRYQTHILFFHRFDLLRSVMAYTLIFFGV